MKYYLPVVPGKFNCSLFDILYHCYLTLKGGDREKIISKINSIIATSYYKHFCILGYSCRSIFEIFIKDYLEKKTDSIMVSPWLHSSFYRILNESSLKVISFDYDENFNLVYPKSKAKYILLSHNFGDDNKLKELREYAIENNIYIIEDMVQGGQMYDTSVLTKNTKLLLFSGGQDKIPVSFGGGFGITKDVEIYDTITNKINELPEDSTFNRLLHVVKKIPLYLLYQNRYLIHLFVVCYQLYQKLFNVSVGPEVMVSNIRKKYPGFKHNGYMKKPSTGQLNSMLNSLMYLPFGDMYKINRNRKEFYKMVKQPWFDGDLDYRNINYYSHIYSTDKNFIEKMSAKGYMCIKQQTWKSFTDELNHLDNTYLVPNLGNLSFAEVKRMILNIRFL
jgi:hypothetical protein